MGTILAILIALAANADELTRAVPPELTGLPQLNVGMCEATMRNRPAPAPLSLAKIIEQLDKLDPGLAAAAPRELEALYLFIKTESVRPQARLSDAVKARLLETKSRAYIVDQLDDRDLVIFYQNALHGLYSRVATEWREHFFETALGRKPAHETAKLLHHVLDTYARRPLGDRDLSVADAAEFFDRKNYRSQNWSELAALIDKWIAERPDRSMGIAEFGRFWQDHHGSFGHHDFERVRTAIMALENPCCEMRCELCPQNFLFLKPRSRE